MEEEKKKMSPDISVVVLCYKEGKPIVDFLSKIKKAVEAKGVSYEIIPVSNFYPGDTDETPNILKNLAQNDSHIKPVSKEKKGGFGWDVRMGLKEARGQTVLFIDGDGQNPAEDVVRVYDSLIENKGDMAQTYRVKRGDGLQRLLNSRIYNIFFKILFPNIKILDANSKPKIFTRSALEKLNLVSDDWFIDAEIVIQATKLKFKISQVPTVFLQHENRVSYVKLSAIYEFIKNLIQYRLKG